MPVTEPPLQRLRMSWEEYLALPERPRAEWVDGEVVVTPAASFEHQAVSRRLANRLETDLAGLHVYEAVNLRLPRDRIRIPDVAVFPSRERGYLSESVPVVVVEVLSPSTRSEDLLRKSVEYAEAGISQYWVLDPAASSLEVFDLVEGRWEPLLRLDDSTPTGEVVVDGHGTVPLDLRKILED
ncbi:Uma2 family endonuclease [Nocardioides sp. AE5]|uniref:Uma2 family endonuclease n=1 Tax=Nocardioides sp. AE5 TaxID=2962573 RepID=UPI002880D0F0|nr:Uma2 family endonuclease [Nocardioides sp. AE5]MDT0203077.1 Uma2 family endonuclease [Nocardioides sp. AE5]